MGVFQCHRSMIKKYSLGAVLPGVFFTEMIVFAAANDFKGVFYFKNGERIRKY